MVIEETETARITPLTPQRAHNGTGWRSPTPTNQYDDHHGHSGGTNYHNPRQRRTRIGAVRGKKAAYYAGVKDWGLRRIGSLARSAESTMLALWWFGYGCVCQLRRALWMSPHIAAAYVLSCLSRRRRTRTAFS